MRVVIFGGTTEGRHLSEVLSQEGVAHHMCVATDYGAGLMDANSRYMTLHTGRMDSAQMKAFFEECGMESGDIIVDATHPYAAEVSKNIAAACPPACRLLVVRRDGVIGPQVYDNESYVNRNNINRYRSMSDFARSADLLSGNILVTTGSKELPDYCANVSPDTLQRSYIRILPSSGSIRICEDLGIDRKKIIAMHGPFSREMNKALMSEYDISHILTKDGGVSGGFEEKLEAANDMGVVIHVIDRPDSAGASDGVSADDAFCLITGKEYRPPRKITLAGIGMGSAAGMTEEVRRAILSADAVFGATRMTEAAKAVLPKRSVSGDDSVRIYEMYRPDDITRILGQEVNITSPIILFSGDTGFFSGAREAYDRLRSWDSEAKITILPGISSVSYLAAKLFESYDDAKIISLHGKNGLHNIRETADNIASNPKVFAIMSGPEDLAGVAQELKEKGIKADIYVGCDLSYKSERTEHLTVEEACGYAGDGLITVLFKRV